MGHEPGRLFKKIVDPESWLFCPTRSRAPTTETWKLGGIFLTKKPWEGDDGHNVVCVVC